MLKYGDLLGAVVDFLIVAVVLFLLVSRVIKLAEGRLLKSKGPEAPTTKECAFCLEKIPVKATKCRACTSAVA
jgi:large conductance mechanosensitive channel